MIPLLKRPAEHQRWLDLGCLLLAVLIATIALFHVRDFYHDDAFITLRYASRLLSGKGLTWSDGERVEGFTHPLWLGQIALLGGLGFDLVGATRVLGVTYLLVLFIIWRRAGAWPLPLLLIASQPGLILWTLGGLETVSFCTWMILGCRLGQRVCEYSADLNPRAQRYGMLLGLALAGAALTRPEGLATGVITLLVVLSRRRLRPALTAAAAFILPVCAYLAFRIAYFGDWIPNSARVKIDGIPFITQFGFAVHYIRSTALEWLPCVAIGALSILFLPRFRSLWVVSLSVPILVSILFGGGDHMVGARLIVPITVLFAYAASINGWPSSRLNRSIISIALCVGLAWQCRIDFSRTVTRDDAAAVGEPVGRFFHEHLPPSTLVALATAGSTPYFAPSLRFIDTLGLNDRAIASRSSPVIITRWQAIPGHRKGDGESVLNRQPDIIVLGPADGYLGTDPRRWFLSDFELLTSPRFQALYRPYVFLVPVTPQEAAWPAVAQRLIPMKRSIALVAYLHTDSPSAAGFARLGALLPVPWRDAPAPLMDSKSIRSSLLRNSE